MLKFPVPSSTSPQDLVEAGIAGMLCWEGPTQILCVNDGATVEEIAAAQEFATTPTITVRKRISDQWALAASVVAALPAAPGVGVDTYAAIRARLTAKCDALKTQIDGMGGLL